MAICRECMHGNFITNICNKGYTRCDGQNCFDLKNTKNYDKQRNGIGIIKYE